jgi:DNA-binding NarL/FixJ family response regulator
MKISVAIADDQLLFLKSLESLINSFRDCETVIDSLNGDELLKALELTNPLPDIALIDVNMPVMNGEETARRISEKYPLIKIVALSMKDDDTTIIKMLKVGCSAYLLKDIHPHELEKALYEIHTTGFYNADAVNLNYRRLILKKEQADRPLLTDRELTFLQLSCSDLTYKQIASQMFLSERTVDGYRESVFQKLNVQSRVGMVLEGIRKNLVSI